MKLDAAVLAGGRSRRMGRDKALLNIEGERLIDRVLRRLSPLGGEIVVARGARPEIDGLGVPQVGDRLSDAGPLAGIETALTHLGTDLIAIVAVDLPYASPEVLRRLADEWDGSAIAVVPEVGGQVQPLHAVWAGETLPQVTAALDAGERSPSAFVVSGGAQVVGEDVWQDLASDATFAANLNRPADLRSGP